jgi:dienelactone hydrolase
VRHWLVLLAVLCGSAATFAKGPRVFPQGDLPNDARLGPLTTLNDHFPFVVPDNPAEWDVRGEFLRRRVAVATGLWPMPERTPLQSVIHGRVQRDGFTVEKVFFQSLPGHFVTGLLFRPSNPSDTPRPGVLNPHGHGGRLQSHSDAEIARQIEVGGEHFQRSGRMPKLARCAQLARMGCVAFIFDMLGYADSLQIEYEVAHRHKEAREIESTATDDSWVFFSPAADLRLQSIMGLQTWNSIRALDFLASLPDVDPDRLAVTGGSGGGTQSILLGALDDRIKVSFPNGMVSTSMQGGCYCENCNLLRIGSGNVELAALFAPKPQAMTAADDWTKDMMTDGYPELNWLYAMVGNESDVYCRPLLHFKHNYNYISRATMYQWMNRHLQLGLDDPVVEQDYEPLSQSDTKVWNEEYPAPTQVGGDHERQVCRWLDQQAAAQIDELAPTDQDSLSRFRQIMGGAWQVIFDLGLPIADQIEYHRVGESTAGSMLIERGIVRNKDQDSELPLLTVRDAKKSDDTTIVIWTDRLGKDVAFDAQGQAGPSLKKLIDGGATVLLPDLLGQGEFNATDEPLKVQRLIDDVRSYSAFTFAYNRTLAAQRCGDLLTIAAHALQQCPDNVTLLCTGESAAWAAPAAALGGDQLARVLIDSGGFRYGQSESYRDANFVPGAVKYGDLPVLLALRSPHWLMVAGQQQLPAIVAQAYAAADASDRVVHSTADRIGDAEIDWLLK